MDTFGKRLEQEAIRVRRFLESRGADLCELFSDFPHGACGNASDILGQLLEEIGISDVQYVSGMRNEKSHGWLEVRGLIVDITSDQFEDGLGPVYVGEASAFHETFTEKRYSVPKVTPALGDVYMIMRKELKADA